MAWIMPTALSQNWQNSGWWLFLTGQSLGSSASHEQIVHNVYLPRADCAGTHDVAPGSDFRLEPRNSRTRRPPPKGSSWSQVLGCYYPLQVSLLQAAPWLTSPERLLRGKFTPSSSWRNFRGKSSSSFKYVKPA